MPTLFGYSVNPADEGSAGTDGTGAPALLEVSITPPSNMVAGQLVVLDCAHRATNTLTSGANDIIETGGQTWTSETKYDTGASLTLRRHWCRFNGTWSANPSVGFDNYKANAPATLAMSVYDPDSAGSTWAVDVAQSTGYVASSTSITMPDTTTVSDNALAITLAVSADNNNFSLTTAGNWADAVPGSDNLYGNDICVTVQYCSQGTAGSTGTYVLTENANGPEQVNYLKHAFVATPVTVGWTQTYTRHNTLLRM